MIPHLKHYIYTTFFFPFFLALGAIQNDCMKTLHWNKNTMTSWTLCSRRNKIKWLPLHECQVTLLILFIKPLGPLFDENIGERRSKRKWPDCRLVQIVLVIQNHITDWFVGYVIYVIHHMILIAAFPNRIELWIMGF